MLKTLSIKNYALIDEINVEFGPGLNILTGETGAGKSIIIGALSLLLGERAKSDIIRQDASSTIVEGLFDFAFSSEKLDTSERIPPAEDGLLLRREIHRSGRNRIFANDSPISNSLLTNLGDMLVDLHGQHAHQTLLKIEQHLKYLDNFGVNPDLRKNVRDAFKQYHLLTEKLKAYCKKETDLRTKQELLEFQVKEIVQTNPVAGEDDALELEEKILSNSEKIFSVVSQINAWLYDEDGSVNERISNSIHAIRGLLEIDSSFEQWIHYCDSARISIDEVVRGLQSYVSKIEFDQERLDKIRERIDLLHRLKKKYGGSLQDVIVFVKKTKKELEEIQTLDETIDKIRIDRETIKDQLIQYCQRLSMLRQEVARQLESQTIKALVELGLEKGIFQVNIRQNEQEDGPLSIQDKHYGVSATGIDDVEFFISMNPGENPRPLAKVASGGEISRIMLALKSVLAQADNVPVLIFDEIDTGISGRIARIVGHYLKEISKNHQVICITHLPQIASMGDRQYCVEKESRNNRTFTTIRQLNVSERIKEIAKLLGGDRITDSTIQSARELMDLQE
jgi:DNA repair protein RecN (Recombination protein N)